MPPKMQKMSKRLKSQRPERKEPYRLQDSISQNITVHHKHTPVQPHMVQQVQPSIPDKDRNTDVTSAEALSNNNKNQQNPRRPLQCHCTQVLCQQVQLSTPEENRDSHPVSAQTLLSNDRKIQAKSSRPLQRCSAFQNVLHSEESEQPTKESKPLERTDTEPIM
ncbi:hypothetical protein CVT25_002450 [Psilocybe cyanescens]|uniref:Uncharacterized protein n=1 Tax=Psilocybe cyanescens TaxID=93625 RepID=A0A409X0E9_PSICY|nr:hypothetical protein CVT25_002450 [Psilocybe cyanescens]